MTKVVRVDAFNPQRELIEECAAAIKEGKLVAFPTETVYGLGADAYNRQAVARVFEVKRRPPDNPLIVHISKLEQLYEVAAEVPEQAELLAKRTWPGPLTLVLKKAPNLPREVTGGLETVAVRMPAHPIALSLIGAAETPVAAPSANISGKPSPTKAEHVLEDLFGAVDIVIDGGETLFGVESTIVDLTKSPPLLLRPGPVPVEELSKLLGVPVEVPHFARGLGEAERALSPGTKYRHYAPRTELVLVEVSDYGSADLIAKAVASAAERERAAGRRVCIVATEETAHLYRGLADAILVLGPRSNMYQVAHNLFAVLRELDKLGVDVAIVEGFEERGLGLAVASRLRKAATRVLKL